MTGDLSVKVAALGARAPSAIEVSQLSRHAAQPREGRRQPNHHRGPPRNVRCQGEAELIRMVLWSTVKSMQALPSCEGLVGEQATIFFRDPAANALKFKSFRESDQLFAK